MRISDWSSDVCSSDLLALKQPDGETRLDLTELTAEAGRDGLRGSFGGASGRIVNVPLRLDQAEGRWTYGGGVLGISAPSARIRDAADERRFEAVSARDVKLALEDGVIRGDAIIARPKAGHIGRPPASTQAPNS